MNSRPRLFSGNGTLNLRSGVRWVDHALHVGFNLAMGGAPPGWLSSQVTYSGTVFRDQRNLEGRKVKGDGFSDQTECKTEVRSRNVNIFGYKGAVLTCRLPMDFLPSPAEDFRVEPGAAVEQLIQDHSQLPHGRWAWLVATRSGPLCRCVRLSSWNTDRVKWFSFDCCFSLDIV